MLGTLGTFWQQFGYLLTSFLYKKSYKRANAIPLQMARPSQDNPAVTMVTTASPAIQPNLPVPQWSDVVPRSSSMISPDIFKILPCLHKVSHMENTKMK